MSGKSKRESPVTGYIAPALKTRAQRVARKAPKLTVSRQIEECLERGLPEIEARVGVVRAEPLEKS